MLDVHHVVTMRKHLKLNHRDPKVASFHAKIDENFVNFFLKLVLYYSKIYMSRATK